MPRNTARNSVNEANLVPSQPKRQKRVQRKRDVKTSVVELSVEEILEAKTYFCNACPKTFIRKQNYDMHLRKHGILSELKSGARFGRDKSFTCPVPDCIRHLHSHALRDITAIKKHYQRMHLKEKKWKCSYNYCDKAFAVNADWKQHEKSHRDSFHCKCGKIFKRKVTMELHAKSCYPELSARINAPAETNNEDQLSFRGTTLPSVLNNFGVHQDSQPVPPALWPAAELSPINQSSHPVSMVSNQIHAGLHAPNNTSFGDDRNHFLENNTGMQMMDLLNYDMYGLHKGNAAINRAPGISLNGVRGGMLSSNFMGFN